MKCEHTDGENCKKYVTASLHGTGGPFPCDGTGAKCAGKMYKLKEATRDAAVQDSRPKRRGKFEVEEHRIPMRDEDISVLHFAASYTLRNPPTKLKKGVEDTLKKWAHRLSMYPPKVG